MADVSAREPIAETDAFRFYSHFETNLNDALMSAGIDRNFDRKELFQSGDEQICFESLAPSLRAGWNKAVDYYAEIVSPHQFDDRQQILIRLHLAALPERRDNLAETYLALADTFIAAAAPAYRACRWSSQEEKNHQWLAELLRLLEQHEQAIATRLALLYGASWPEDPFDVDIVETVSWAGANSYFPVDRAGHLMMASEPEAMEALETVFHEASHGFMMRGDPLRVSLAEAVDRRGIDPPRGLWHVILFVTTGETVRNALNVSGETGYEPMIYDVYPRSDWGQYREAMGAVWPDYLDGKLTAGEAMTKLIDAIAESSE